MIRIAIVDDHPVVRAGLKHFLSDQSDMTVVAEAVSGREAVDIVRAGGVDVMLMDISMPDQSGVDALIAIRARAPELPVLMLSIFPEVHYATTLLKQGASGYLSKDCDPQELVSAIRSVAIGRKHISPAVARRCIAPGKPSAGPRSGCRSPSKDGRCSTRAGLPGSSGRAAWSGCGPRNWSCCCICTSTRP